MCCGGLSYKGVCVLTYWEFIKHGLRGEGRRDWVAG